MQKTGERIWSYASPAKRSVLLRNLLGNLLIADGKVLWTSRAAGGGVCLNLEDGTEVWTEPTWARPADSDSPRPSG